MPAMSHVEALLCRSAPWRAFATRVVMPWALAGEELAGNVLEIGSGSGAMAEALLRRYPELTLTATDYDPQMVLSTARRVAQFGPRATVAQADASTLPFDDNAFDLALTFLMLHHVGAWEKAVEELVRVVRPGGRVLGLDMVDNRFLTWSEHTFGSGEERLIRLAAFERLLDGLGLQNWTVERGHLSSFRFALHV